MMKRRICGLAIWFGLCATALLLTGCTTNKPVTLVAQGVDSRIVAATIDVNGSACSIRVMLTGSPKAWTPECLVRKDQSGFKSLNIDGTQVDFGAISNGFKVLSSTLPTIQVPSASTAAAPAAAGTAKTAAAAKPAPAVPTPAAQPPAAPPDFPTQWSQSPYPGTLTLQGQNTGFLITSAILQIHGSQGTLDVRFKASYSPLHMVCTVVTNQHGDFNLIFNPSEASRLTGGGNSNIQLVSEGTSITGNIWDSHGFDSWTPGLPPQWVATAVSRD